MGGTEEPPSRLGVKYAERTAESQDDIVTARL